MLEEGHPQTQIVKLARFSAAVREGDAAAGK